MQIEYSNDRFSVISFYSELNNRKFYVIDKNDAVVVIPVRGDKVLLLSVKRERAASSYLEFVAGRIEDHETALEAAIRELREETGIVATHLHQFGSVAPLPSLVSECVTGFILEVPDTTEAQIEGTHEGIIDYCWVEISRLPALCMDSKIKCSVDAFFAMMLHYVRGRTEIAT